MVKAAETAVSNFLSGIKEAAKIDKYRTNVGVFLKSVKRYLETKGIAKIAPPEAGVAADNWKKWAEAADESTAVIWLSNYYDGITSK